MGANHDHGTVEHGPGDASFWWERETLSLVVSGFFLAVGLVLWLAGVTTVIWDHPLGRTTLVDWFYVLAILIGGIYTARSAWDAVRSGRLSVELLIALAVLGALALGKLVEAAALVFLYGVAERLEDWAMVQARASLKEIQQHSPDEARLVREETTETVPVEHVQPGDLVEVRPGERIAMDGEIVEGQSAINQAPVTGESMPVEKGPGDEVFAGTLTTDGRLLIRVSRPADQRTISRIVDMIREADEASAPSQRFVEQFASYYTPAVVVVAIIVGLGVPMVPGVPGGLAEWWLRAMALLVIACPCGLLISTPVTVVSGITSAARQGNLIRTGEVFERMGELDVVCFDKTGTLTTGEPGVRQVDTNGRLTREEVLRVIGALETGSNHPLAEAMEEYARTEVEQLPEVENFREHAAKGVSGDVLGENYRLGKPNWFDDCPSGVRDLQEEGMTVVCLGDDSGVIGLVGLEDGIRPRAQQTLNALKRLGIRTVMVTGDNERSARAVGNKLGVDEIHAGLLPEDKVQILRGYVKEGRTVAMVGDGINDGPALKAAHVGIAMGAAGSDTAIETADLALLGDDLVQLPYLVNLSRQGKRIIKQNVYSSVAIKLALGLGVIPGWVNLVVAVLVGDMAVSFGVTGNAMRLRTMEPEREVESVPEG